MEFLVSLDQFEGPLDLMLHLVRKNKLDLFDLDLEKLAEQYCTYIRQASQMHLEISSEYLEECTILMEYKSRRLLPGKPEQEEDSWQEDPAKKLALRLAEYQKCQEESERLSRLYEMRSKQIERSVIELKEEWLMPKEEARLVLQSADLLKAMQRVLRRHALLQPYQTSVEVRELSVAERMDEIRSRFNFSAEPVMFDTLCADCQCLHEVIVTFLAVLELVHSGEIYCYMKNEPVTVLREEFDSELSRIVPDLSDQTENRSEEAASDQSIHNQFVHNEVQPQSEIQASENLKQEREETLWIIVNQPETIH